jgi:succinylglutamate desuccinylase
MSEAMPRPVELPTPSAEQLAEWHALIQRIRQGDRSQVVAWDQVTAARAAATYQVLVTQRVRQRLRDVPPTLVGSVAGVIAVLRVDPTEASTIFRRRRLGDAGWTVTFGAARGLLSYWVVQPERIVALLDLTWAG